MDRTRLNTFFFKPFQGISINDIIRESVEAHPEEISDINTKQLLKGLDSEGKDLGTYKNFAYKNRFRPVDLKLTGDFHRSISPDAGKDNFEMKATDFKTEKLKDKYGDEILGIAKQSISEVGKIILPDIQEKFKDELHKS